MHDWPPEIRKRLGTVRLSPVREAEIVEELSQHLEDLRDDLIAGGTDPDTATRLALAQLNEDDGLARRLAPLRQAGWSDPTPPPPRRWFPLQGLMLDLRRSIRSLAASPGFTTVALIVLTLSIGATTAIVSVVDAVIVNPLPFHEPGRLVAVGEFHFKSGSANEPNLVAPQNFQDWREQQEVFTGLAAIGYASINLKPQDGREPETLKAQAVTADFFPVLGTAPLMGRTFTAENERDGNALVAVISHGLWQRRFGGAPDVVGRYLHGIRADFRIVAVMPRTFAYPVGAVQPTEVWIPNVFRADERVRGHEFSYRLQVIGRLRPGVTLQQAQAQMDQITAGLRAETPKWFENRVAKVESLHAYLTKGVQRWLFLLLAGVGMVLLIACVNLSNLTLARVSARAKEFVIRAALGASRWDLARALLMESLCLSLIGSALGVLLALAGVEMLRAAMPAEMPRAGHIEVNFRILAATAVVAVATGLIFSILPMFHFSRRNTQAGLAMTSRASTTSSAHRWFRGVLVVAEVALAVVLLVGSGLFLESFRRVTSVDLGLDPHDVLTVRVRPLVGSENWDAAQKQNRPLMRNVLERVRLIPGVQVASFVGSGVPLRGDLRTVDFAIPGGVLPPDESLDFNEISPDYFRTMRVPLLSGRFFTDRDRQGSEAVAIINEAAAKKFFPEQDALGKVIQFDGLRTVVGIVGNIRHDGPETDWRRQGFVPLDQSRAVGATLVLRLSRQPGDVVPDVKAAIWSQFPGVPLPDIQTIEEYLRGLTAQRRFNMLLLGLFGLLGVVIALVGIYGVMAYDVTHRTREMGIRMALGALPVAILQMVLKRASLYLACGLGIGILAAWTLSELVKGFLFQIQPHDIRVYAAVAAVLLMTGLAAAFVPARRASRVDPLISLRLE